MKVAIYSRVSTKEQDPESQLRQVREFCSARGHEVVKEFVDHGVSGAKARRPALDQLLTGCSAREFEAVVVWKLDRLGRSLSNLIEVVKFFESAKVEFISVTDSIDTSTLAGRFCFHLFGAVAEFERGLIRERVQSGVDRVKANGGIGKSGKRIGRPSVHIPLGKARELRDAGVSIKRIALQLGVSRDALTRRLEVQS